MALIASPGIGLCSVSMLPGAQQEHFMRCDSCSRLIAGLAERAPGRPATQ